MESTCGDAAWLCSQEVFFGAHKVVSVHPNYRFLGLITYPRNHNKIVSGTSRGKLLNQVRGFKFLEATTKVFNRGAPKSMLLLG